MLATATADCRAATGGRTSSSGTACAPCVDVTRPAARIYSRRRQRRHRRPIRSSSRWPAAVDDALLDGEIVALRRRPAVLRAAAEHGCTCASSRRGSPPGRRDAGHLRRFRRAAALRRRPHRPPVRRAARHARAVGRRAPRTGRSARSFDDGPATEAAAREHGLEGVVAKRPRLALPPGHPQRATGSSCGSSAPATSSSSAGRRPPDASRRRSARSCSAITTDGGLRVAGKVGSGLTGRLAAAAAAPLLTERADCPVPRASRRRARPA